MWSGRPDHYINLKVFGSEAYAYAKGDKLEKRALKCIFLGYPKGIEEIYVVVCRT